ncbi:MAG: hypothetical protein IPN97_12780 [Saprospiraceae bacterium]|nr:hypothetical protein [Saprospiraceae bacterium]
MDGDSGCGCILWPIIILLIIAASFGLISWDIIGKIFRVLVYLAVVVLAIGGLAVAYDYFKKK